jgi:hypothetical protein
LIGKYPGQGVEVGLEQALVTSGRHTTVGEAGAVEVERRRDEVAESDADLTPALEGVTVGPNDS